MINHLLICSEGLQGKKRSLSREIILAAFLTKRFAEPYIIGFGIVD
jgi:hypothetical protein